jgi:outer membrane protein OmpA-like peptidoglycan-associated protein
VSRESVLAVRPAPPVPSKLVLHRKCDCGQRNECNGCGEERKVKLQRSAIGPHPIDDVPPIVHEVLGSPGQPLDAATRAFMDSRLGHDFSRVRVHTGNRAATAARAVNALAYTVGPDVTFGAGQFAPDTSVGRRLLAHELTHVMQQRSNPGDARAKLSVGDAGTAAEVEADRIADGVISATSSPFQNVDLHQPLVQRACGADQVGQPPSDCELVSDRPTGERFEFAVNCDDFENGESAKLLAFARRIKSEAPAATIGVLGLASFDGDSELNKSLSCHRADVAASILRAEGLNVTSVRATGGVPGTAGDRHFRAVDIQVHADVPKVIPKCGPDATDWFVTQVNMAMSDPVVRAIKATLSSASLAGPSQIIAEAGATAAVQAQEFRLGTGAPARAGAIVGQMGTGVASEVAAAAFASRRPVDALGIASDIAVAALLWRGLVNHAARYDFKAHTDSMRFPRGAHCPDEGCPPGEVGIITLCPTPNSENCYESDLPGNMFYAMIGRHVGWSELTLQLGSQLAELTDLPRPGRPAITWDTPDDTAAIHLGFTLGAALPLTRGGLCGAILGARGSLNARVGCDDCLDPTPSIFR